MIRFGSTIVSLSSTSVGGPYVVVELFEGGFTLISNVKSGKQFKASGHHLKPYLT